jgi:protein SCO1/2
VTERTASPGPHTPASSFLDGPFRVVVVMTVAFAVLVGSVVVRGAFVAAPSASPTASPAASIDVASYLYPATRPAPALVLTDQDGTGFDLASLRGGPTFVFFGYTHCPDVCPATMGVIGQVLEATQAGLHVVFVSVDPERDTAPWLKEYVRYLPAGITALTGSAAEIRAAADAWGVRYAKVTTNDPAVYSMSHTADVYILDANGALRGRFPFGTQPDAMLAVLARIAATTPSATPTAIAPTPGPTAVVTPAPTPSVPAPSSTPTSLAGLTAEVVSSSVWAFGKTPVILRLRGPEGPLVDTSASVSVQLKGQYGDDVGPPAVARAVHPEGVDIVSWVAVLDVPDTGWWDLQVTLTTAEGTRTAWASISALDPGSTPALGGPAPTVRTPTLDDVAGRALAVTTDPVPDLRLSRTSTADALSAGEPFVLVVDSIRFKVTPVCGKAVALVKYLLDRWGDETFIHLEPYSYQVISDTAILDGSLSAPILVPAAEAWGTGGPPWGAASMPWVFIVDRHGIVRAKYQGIVGSDDIDVMLSLLASEP